MIRQLILIAIAGFASFSIGAAAYDAAMQGLVLQTVAIVGMAFGLSCLVLLYKLGGAITSGGSYRSDRGVTFLAIVSPAAAAILGAGLGAADQGA